MTDDIIQRAREALSNLFHNDARDIADDAPVSEESASDYRDVKDALDLAERLEKRNAALASDWHKIVAGVIGPRPMCRDCADEDGTCPHNDGLPCDTTDEVIERFKRLQQDNERLRLENERLTFASDPEALTIAHMHGAASARDEIERLTKFRDECKAGSAEMHRSLLEVRTENARLVKALHEACRPIGWQDVRLAVGEGKLTNNDVLNGVNAELRRRIPKIEPGVEG